MNESFLLVRNFAFCHYTLYKFDQLRIDSIVKLREETANTHPRVEPEECVYELLNLNGAHLCISYYISTDDDFIEVDDKIRKVEDSRLPQHRDVCI